MTVLLKSVISRCLFHMPIRIITKPFCIHLPNPTVKRGNIKRSYLAASWYKNLRYFNHTSIFNSTFAPLSLWCAICLSSHISVYWVHLRHRKKVGPWEIGALARAGRKEIGVSITSFHISTLAVIKLRGMGGEGETTEACNKWRTVQKATDRTDLWLDRVSSAT